MKLLALGIGLEVESGSECPIQAGGVVGRFRVSTGSDKQSASDQQSQPQSAH